MLERTESWLSDKQTWLRCRVSGHLYAVQQFEYHTHKMVLICNRCGETQTTIVPKVKLMPGQDSQPRATEH